MTPSVDGNSHVAKTHYARLAIVTDRRQPNDSALCEDIDAEDADVTLHHTLEASRASAHLAAVFGCPTGVLASGLDIGQRLREQLLKR